ncbi:MAG TPA: VOC family protein [Streptosporangiaceae bacterium]|nr:VOC family protein [Streptosporangiaceae bacterium]
MAGQGLTTCLWFDTEGEQAAHFYLSIFKDSKLGRIGRYTEAGPGQAGSAMTVEFELNGQKFLALNGGPAHQFNQAISLIISCADQAEVDYYWDRLCDGGEEVACGWVTDRYGLSWQVVPAVLIDLITDPDPATAKRVTEAMFTMKKLDIAALQRAHAGAS